jgi:hypothetical protein
LKLTVLTSNVELNLVEFKFHSIYLNSIQFKNVVHASISFRCKVVVFTLRTLRIFYISQGHLSFFLLFSMLLVLLQIMRIYCMLHIASYQHYSFVEIHLYQSHFNISCYRHMNICCLIRLCLDIMLFKKLLTKKQMSLQNVRMEKCFLY